MFLHVKISVQKSNEKLRCLFVARISQKSIAPIFMKVCGRVCEGTTLNLVENWLKILQNSLCELLRVEEIVKNA